MADHEVILEKLQALKEDTEALLTQVRETNGRLRKAETNVAVLRWAVFGGGTGVLGALGYIIQMHLK